MFFGLAHYHDEPQPTLYILLFSSQHLKIYQISRASQSLRKHESQQSTMQTIFHIRAKSRPYRLFRDGRALRTDYVSYRWWASPSSSG